MKKIVISLIKIYQKTLSPDHGPLSFLYSEGFCRFKPSCSQYTIDAVERFGVGRGIVLGFYRINRCNPWSKGGIDTVDNVTSKYFFKGLALIFVYLSIISILMLVLVR